MALRVRAIQGAIGTQCVGGYETFGVAMTDPVLLIRAPRVSVILPTFNVAAYAARAISSVQEQSFAHWELIVVDDHSTDATCDIVAKIARVDPRIRLIRRERNGGAGAARNIGIEHARGDWVALIDADDSWRPERLERLLDVAASTGAEFVADNQIYYDDRLREETGRAARFPQRLSRVEADDLFRSESDGQFPLSLLKPIITRRYLDQNAVRYVESLRFAEDMHLYARLLIHGISAVVVDEAMYVYTTPIGRISKSKSLGSRTINSAGSKIWIADDILRRYRRLIDDNLRLEILRYRARACAKRHAQRLSDLRRRGKWLTALIVAAGNPGSTCRYAFKSQRFRRHMSGKGRENPGTEKAVSVQLSAFTVPMASHHASRPAIHLHS